MAEPLEHNPSNPVTIGVWRVPHAGGTAIRKHIGAREPGRHVDWQASDDPRSWLYWRREAEVYASALPSLYEGSGVRAPRLLALHTSDARVELLLEEVAGRTGPALTDRDVETFFFRLGRAQGTLADAPERWERPWLSRGMLRAHCASKHVDPTLLHDDTAWAHPLVRDTWPSGLREGLIRLHDGRERLFQIAESCPTTLCHLDCWPKNLIQPDGHADSVLIDWAFCGAGALGEDLGNWLAESVLDELLPAERLAERTAVLLERYTHGVLDSGWTGDPAHIALAMHASAVKWHWLGPLHLQRAQTGEHHRYGGAADPHPEAQYRARGHALAALVSWADQALTMADNRPR